MTVSEKPVLHPLVVGANHKSSTMMLRDRIFIEEDRTTDILQQLKSSGIKQVIVVSTCDRVDFISVCENPETVRGHLLDAMAHEGQMKTNELEGQTYSLTDGDAVRHIFKVCSSLDSLMIGEPQIHGQVKSAHQMAVDAGTVGPELEALMQAAYGAAKRVRSETHIGEGPVSMASSAVQVVRDLFGQPERCRALLIGAGDMGELIARDMQQSGLGHLSVIHPRSRRGEAIAKELSAHSARFEDLPELLINSDIVITALGSRSFTLNKPDVMSALKARRRRPIFIVDAAVPGDVEPAVEELDDAFVYGLGDLERVALKGRAGREGEAAEALLILDEEVDNFLNSLAERVAVPVLVRMRNMFEDARKQAMQDCGGDGEKATKLLTGRLLHGPSAALRRAASQGRNMDEITKILEDLFSDVLDDFDNKDDFNK